MNILIYSKPNCPFCVKAKQLLNKNNLKFNEVVIGQDIIREDFITLFPDIKTVPLIIIDEATIGGYTDLQEYLDEYGPKLLTE